MDLNERLVQSLLKQQRSDRRWRNIRFLIWIVVILIIFTTSTATLRSLFSADTDMPLNAPYVSLVRMDGMIMPGRPFSAENLVPALTDAFKDKQSKGVIIEINSGGGAPVQSSIIYDTIMRLKLKTHKPVMIVGEDAMASGAFMVAMAGDEIYVNPNTITGSIGVLTEGFGFVKGMKKIGVTRRVFTSGQSKVRLDPFKPLSSADVQKIQSVLDEVHSYFIDVVKTSRGKKLQGDPAELFSGDFWTGIRAKELGLVDGFGDIHTVMQEQFKVTHYKDYTPQPPLLQSLVGSLGTALHFNFGEAVTGGLLKA